MPSDLKFLVDAMLGRLAKWLRLLGYDTLYEATADDHDLVRLARAEGRLLLTRDRELARRKALNSLFIESDRPEEQLAQLLRDLRLDSQTFAPRCARCNTLLEAMDRKEAKGRVPSYVFSRHEEFTFCPQCQRVYWPGTHWQRMRQRIEEIRQTAANPS
ncbi:MAG: Mut7-C RNAse domain-containing protein [Anaerolineae bacterium]|nr:Mut7-C RNAse domain-containing protein [Anaerolineae bacterium]